ncbi:MAG: hypothetical protein GC149_13350 [Gammaproteobacteria bacterium]|nr:hypothetical protein [Gammaproteobacteria bacterium]
MFVGHYGVGFAAKAVKKTIPLWQLFIAVQLVDIAWATLVLFGVEKFRIVPGITAASPLDLYYIPYTHSLLAVVIWSLAAMVIYRFAVKRSTWLVAGVIAVTVLSHWLLDLLVHRPDLPLYDNHMKVGLGLWNYPVLSFALEALCLFGGMFFYYRATQPVGGRGRYAMIVFGLVMLGVQSTALFSPPPPSANAVAVMALVSYFLFAAVVYWLEKKRA